MKDSNDYRHFKTFIDSDGILFIGWDSPWKANLLTMDAMEELHSIMEGTENNLGIKGNVLFSLKPEGFCFGADLKMIAEIDSVQKFEDWLRQGHLLFNNIEALKKPNAVVLHGPTMGGGTELALTFKRRVMSDDARSSIALPEVKSNLIPGLGGLVRLPKIVGIVNALLMATTGKNIYAYQAKKMELVDDIVKNIPSAERTIKAVSKEATAQTAKRRILEMASGKIKREIPVRVKMARFMENMPIVGYAVREAIFARTKYKARKVSRGYYTAPEKIIGTVKKAYGKPVLKACLEIEMPAFVGQAMMPLTKRLIGIFFRTEAAKRKSLPGGRKLNPTIDRIGILGAGLIGRTFALIFAKKGFDVVLVDLDEKVLSASIAENRRELEKELGKKMIKPYQLAEILGRIYRTTDNANLRGVGVVVDATKELLDIKQKALAATQAIVPNALYWCTTSTIPISKIIEGASDAEKSIVCGFHPFTATTGFEIIPSKSSGEETVAVAFETAKMLGKVPFLVKDDWGFLGNRILMAGMLAGIKLLINGVRASRIDAVMRKYGNPMGLFEVAQFVVGIGTASHVVESMRNLPHFANVPNLLEKMLKAECTFYTRKWKRTVESKALYELLKKEYGWKLTQKYTDSGILEIVLSAMRKEALMCIDEGIIESAKDLDLLFMLATGIPTVARGGLLEELYEEEMRPERTAQKETPKILSLVLKLS